MARWERRTYSPRHPNSPRPVPREGSLTMSSLLAYSLVAAGGSLGAVARFALASWIAPLVPAPFPLATFLINVTGSFLLGIVGTLAVSNVFPNSDAIRLALGVGFL